MASWVKCTDLKAQTNSLIDQRAMPRVGLRALPLWLRAVDFLFPGVARILGRAIIVIL